MSKVVLVTGASSGFGEATARKFASQGRRLILAARRKDKLVALQNELQTSCEVYAAPMDVTNPDSVDQFFADLPTDFQQVDVLINNAGLALALEPAYEVAIDDWQTMVETNVLGLIRVTRTLLPSMVERNTGHIINIGSVAASWPYPGGNAYGASKAFVQNFSRGLRADLLGKNIRVTNIEPGLSETNFSNVRFKGDDAKADAVYKDTKPLSPEDIADIIYWVHSTPAHVNINNLDVMPTCQAWGTSLAVNREMADFYKD